MSNLKTGKSKAVALACCGIFALSCVGFAELDKTEIVPCDVLPSVEYKADNFSVTTTGTTEVSEEMIVSEEIKTEIVTSAAAEQRSEETTVKETVVPKSETASVKNTGGVKRIYIAETAATSVDKSETVSTTESKVADTEKYSDVTSYQAEETFSTTVSSDVTDTKKSEESSTETNKTTTKATASESISKATTTTKETTTAKDTTASTKTTTTTAPATSGSVPDITVLPQKPVTDNGTTPESRFNAATLTPDQCLTGNDHKILTKYLDKIITDDMSNYEKALACYDYLIKNTYYDYGGWSDPVKAVLEDGYGTCTEYSRVYAYMLRYIGFDAKTVDGMTAMAAGGYGYHMWVEVTINGQVYVCDPQVDDNMSSATKISHARFCKTYDEVKGQYIKA